MQDFFDDICETYLAYHIILGICSLSEQYVTTFNVKIFIMFHYLLKLKFFLKHSYKSGRHRMFF